MAKRSEASGKEKAQLGGEALTGVRKVNEYLAVLPSDSELEYYVLNIWPIKCKYEGEWLSKVSSTYKLSKEILLRVSVTQLFDVEVLDWQSIKLSLDSKVEHCSDMLFNGHSHSPIQSHKAYISKKAALEHLKRIHKDTGKHVGSDSLFSNLKLSLQHLNAHGSSYGYELHHMLDKARLEGPTSDVYIRWFGDIDRYIMRAYNNEGNTPRDNMLLRLKAQALHKGNGALLGTLVIGRLIGYCKVRLLLRLENTQLPVLAHKTGVLLPGSGRRLQVHHKSRTPQQQFLPGGLRCRAVQSCVKKEDDFLLVCRS
eukprot:TRINITY_DN10732_c0_g1_i6.p1 TRINITY_DN10732_c0_g1~~TRINITY_DN10732_c0_g1_i6.p1  ORF type:complete len:312 (+),score=40.34 TRINITY_DN10732_c0_g1_i6:469-1404(+)